MVNRIDKKRLLEDMILAYFGVPILPIEINTEDELMNFITPALIKYYKFCPYEWRVSFTPGQQGGYFQVPDLSEKFSQLKPNESYFVGVTMINKAPSIKISPFNDLTFNPLLYNSASLESFDLEEHIMSVGHIASITDFFEDDLTFQYDPITNRIYVSQSTTPVSIALGYGFTIIDYVPYQHLDVVAMMTAYQLAHTLRVARGTLTISSEVDLNEDVLSDIIEKLNERIPRELDTISIPVLLYA